MNWEELTAPEFTAAVERCGRVCVIPMGVIEKHGDHLPLGVDAFKARRTAQLAAEIEPFMVFPFYYLGQNFHAKCEPGAIALKFDLLHQLLESICDEICRNGFNKIVVFSSHGGNYNMLNYFGERLLDAEKPYSFLWTFAGNLRKNNTLCTAKIDGHGGEVETSMMMALCPELVKDDHAATYGMPLGREAGFRELNGATPTGWYSDHPRMLAGDDTPGTVEKGEALYRLESENLARLVRRFKQDASPAKLYHEFHARCRNPLSPSV